MGIISYWLRVQVNMKVALVFSLLCIWNKNKCWRGMIFVCGDFDWIVVVCYRLNSCDWQQVIAPPTSEKMQEEDSLIQDYQEHEFKNKRRERTNQLYNRVDSAIFHKNKPVHFDFLVTKNQVCKVWFISTLQTSAPNWMKLKPDRLSSRFPTLQDGH